MPNSWSWETEKANYLFEFRAKSVALWEEKALSLKLASEKIYANLVEISETIEQDVNTGKNTDKSTYFLASGLSSIWMLSSGYAVESSIKALIILTVSPSTPIIIEKKRKKYLNINVLFGVDSHNLNNLLKKVEAIYKPKFTDEELLFMYRMTTYTIWRGKYPIPLSAVGLTYSGQIVEQELIEKIMNRSEKYPEPVQVKNDNDKKVFDNIFSKIFDKLSVAKISVGTANTAPDA